MDKLGAVVLKSWPWLLNQVIAVRGATSVERGGEQVPCPFIRAGLAIYPEAGRLGREARLSAEHGANVPRLPCEKSFVALDGSPDSSGRAIDQRGIAARFHGASADRQRWRGRRPGHRCGPASETPSVPCRTDAPSRRGRPGRCFRRARCNATTTGPGFLATQPTAPRPGRQLPSRCRGSPGASKAKRLDRVDLIREVGHPAAQPAHRAASGVAWTKVRVRATNRASRASRVARNARRRWSLGAAGQLVRQPGEQPGHFHRLPRPRPELDVVERPAAGARTAAGDGPPVMRLDQKIRPRAPWYCCCTARAMSASHVRPRSMPSRSRATEARLRPISAIAVLLMLSVPCVGPQDPWRNCRSNSAVVGLYESRSRSRQNPSTSSCAMHLPRVEAP